MRISVLTLFKEYYDSFKEASIIKKALGTGTVDLEIYDIRENSDDPGKRVDDVPFGGGMGMLLKCQPVVDTIKKVRKDNSKVIYMSPRGETLTQSKVRELSKEDDLVILCGHYEGIDERILDYVDEEISIGDYILTGGEVASLVLLDSIIRLTDGTIKEESHLDESFENGLLEYPQYTSPRVYEGKEVPEILFSGNHEAIDKWRRKESLRITRDRRKDLFDKVTLSKKDLKLMNEIDNNEIGKWEINAIEKARKFTKKVADKEEYLKVLDSNGCDTGKVEKRSTIHREELFHNEVALWIIDKENKKVLVQRRSKNKKLNPNKLALIAGHVVGNETIFEALKKEAMEEVGINIDEFVVKSLIVLKREEPSNHCFSYQYIIEEAIDINDLIIQEEEVEEVLYIDYFRLRDLAQNNSDEVIFKWDSYEKVFFILDELMK